MGKQAGLSIACKFLYKKILFAKKVLTTNRNSLIVVGEGEQMVNVGYPP